MKKGKIIVFEGIDGAGKSEVSKLVAEKLDIRHIESPLDPFQETRKYVNQHTPLKGQFLFYLSTNFDLSQEFYEESSKGNDVVCARYYFSSLIDFSSRMNTGVEELMKQTSISHSNFFYPDKTILLYVNETEQKKRLSKRNNGINFASDKYCLENEVYRTKVNVSYMQYAKKQNWDIIDTSNMNIAQVVYKSLEFIGGKK